MASGHVRKRGKKWAYIHYITDPSSGDGKHRWKGGFATKSDAQKALREAITAHEQGTFVEPSKMRFGDYIERIWLPHLEDQLESSTVESYSRNMRNHVLPRVGGVTIQKLSPTHLNDVYRELQQQDVALPAGTNRRHSPKVYERIAYLRRIDTSYSERRSAVCIRDSSSASGVTGTSRMASSLTRQRSAMERLAPPHSGTIEGHR